jgi:hypothetical protein
VGGRDDDVVLLRARCTQRIGQVTHRQHDDPAAKRLLQRRAGHRNRQQFGAGIGMVGDDHDAGHRLGRH